jgi:hypothetical protein
MPDDVRIRAGLDAMLHATDVPVVPLNSIQQKIAQQRAAAALPHRKNQRRFAAVAAAVVAALIASAPIISPALVQDLQARYRAAIRALGGIAPPPAPHAFVAQLKSQPAATLVQAQARVSFTLVAPAGLPKDVVSSKILTTPSGVYSKASHTWSAGPVEVTFSYRRADGREFTLLAGRYDALRQPPKYVFDAQGIGRNGRPVLAKYEHFAWRNGDQLMQATADEDLTAAEIQNIERAMGGVAVRERNLHSPDNAPDNVLHIITKP